MVGFRATTAQDSNVKNVPFSIGVRFSEFGFRAPTVYAIYANPVKLMKCDIISPQNYKAQIF